MNVAILREAGGLGDVLRTLTAAEGLRQKYPEARLHYFGLPQFRPLVERCPAVDVYHDGGIDVHRRRPRGAAPDPRRYPYLDVGVDFDLVVDLYCPGLAHELETSGAPLFDRVELFCRAAGVAPRSPHLPLTRAEIEFGRGYLAALGAPDGWAVAVAPFSLAPERDWPLESFAFLCRALLAAGFLPVCFYHRQDDARSEAVRRLPGAHCLGLPLLSAAAVMSRCRMFIGPDTGLLHLAGALGLPALGIFGPTSGEIILRPYPLAEAVHSPGPLARRADGFPCAAPCYACGPRGYRRDLCRQYGCAMLRGITPEQILWRSRFLLKGLAA